MIISTAMTPPLSDSAPADASGPALQRCPRCGYDQSGVISSWCDSCPLLGTCSECGLTFEWRRIHAGEGLAPGWSFEHGELSWRRLAGTLARGVVPWVLWRGVPIECPVRVWRLVWLVLLMLPLVHLMAAGAVLVMDPPGGFRPGAVPWDRLIGENIEAFVVPYVMRVKGVPLAVPFGAVLGCAFFLPFSMLILGESLKRKRLRAAHVVRGYCWSWVSGVPVAIAMLLGAFLVSWLESGGRIASGKEARNAYLVVAGVFPVWLWGWWYGFIGRYLKLPNAFWVTTLMLIVAMLASATVAWLGNEVLEVVWKPA